MYPFFIVVSERNVHVQEGMILLLHSFVGIQIETALENAVDWWMRAMLWTGGCACFHIRDLTYIFESYIDEQKRAESKKKPFEASKNKYRYLYMCDTVV